MDSLLGGMAWWGYLFIALFFIVLLIAWIVLPFAIIGTKPILHRILQEQERTNRLLESLSEVTARASCSQ